MPGQAAATLLCGRHQYFDAVSAQDLDGRQVYIGIQHLLNAAGEQSDTRTLWFTGGSDRGPVLARRQSIGKKAQHGLNGPGHEWRKALAENSYFGREPETAGKGQDRGQ